jgi:hypothetical protein
LTSKPIHVGYIKCALEIRCIVASCTSATKSELTARAAAEYTMPFLALRKLTASATAGDNQDDQAGDDPNLIVMIGKPEHADLMPFSG